MDRLDAALSAFPLRHWWQFNTAVAFLFFVCSFEIAASFFGLILLTIGALALLLLSLLARWIDDWLSARAGRRKYLAKAARRNDRDGTNTPMC